MPTEAEIEVVRIVIRDEIRRFWEADRDVAQEMIDGYRVMARKALEALERLHGSNFATPDIVSQFNVGTTTLLAELRDIARSIEHQVPNSPERRAADCIDLMRNRIRGLEARLK